MQTKLSRICDAIIEAGWLAALVVTPLFFNTLSNRVFEPDKIHLLRSIAMIMVVAWAVQLLDRGLSDGSRPADDESSPRPGFWARMGRIPLVLPALIMIVAYLISTLLSVVPRISFFGSYVRMQGTLTFLSYVAIFAMVLTHLRSRAQVNRLIYAVIIASIPISIYGLIQHYHLDPLPWGGNVTKRIAANMGNAIFVAAYLIMAVFLTLERLVDSMATLLSEEQGSTASALGAGGYLFVLAIQLIAIVFTQSRGPWLGLAAGLYIFGLLGVLLLGRWAETQPRAPSWTQGAVRPVWFGLIGLTVAGLAFLIVLNLPQGPLKGLREEPYIDRMATLLDTKHGTNAVRVLIWEGVVDMMLKPHPPIQYPDGTPDKLNIIRPLVGYGPESMWVAYNRFYPPGLAHYEARNASPDRSHNETFDALVRTGFIGFGAEIFLFGSIFYYALRWLGLMRGRRRRNLFLGLLAGGAVVGVVVPWLADGSLRLAGVGLPAGLIAGVIIYVTLDVLLSPRALGGEALPRVKAVTGKALGGRRQLLILAVFSAIVAHFVEVHTGIAIVATRTHFWIFSALLVVVGMGWLDRDEAHDVAPAAVATASQPSGKAQPARGPRSGRKGRKSTRSEKRAAARRRGTKRSQVQRPRPAVRARPPSSILAFLPYAGIVALVTLVLTWDYLVNQTGVQGAFAILWNAFTSRADSTTYQIIRSPALLMLLVFTWVVGGLLALTESFRQRPAGSRFSWGANATSYAGITLGVFLIYGLIHASRTQTQGFVGLDVFHHVASFIVVFDVALLIIMLGLAAALWLADRRPRPGRAFRALPAVPLIGSILLTVVALFVIVDVNIQTVQADMYYKQGLSYEGASSWESAAILYLKAAQLEPHEDYYDLFLGRSLLQFSSAASSGQVTLPEDLSQIQTADLLPLVQRGLRSRTKEDLMRASQAALVAARRLNPLNTDHSANLARLNRSWAFINALGPKDVPSNALLRRLVSTEPDKVNMERLNRSLMYYQEATSLSPHNAQLWNELATVQFILGDTQSALKTLDHSLTLDTAYDQTYLLRAELDLATGDKAAALEAYRQAAALRPKDSNLQSAVGVYSAQVGDAEGALAAFQRVTEIESGGLASAQRQLANLESLANRAGGYDKLLPAAGKRRDALQRSITNHRSQLHLNYRNMAIVLRDAGRLDEALQAAQAALPLASDAERPTIEALIGDLQKRLGQ